MKNVTMQDIADRLQISKSAVSRALSNKYGINEKTRALVWAEAYRMGYQAANPQKLKSALTNNITVYLPRSALKDTNYHTRIISGIELALKEHNKKMVLTLVDDYDDASQTPFTPPQPEDTQGIVILADAPDRYVELVSATGLPMILIDFKRLTDQPVNHVLANNYRGMYEAAQYLIARGHRRLIYAGNNEYAYSFSQRYHGCRGYIEHYNQLHPDDPVHCEYILSSSGEGLDLLDEAALCKILDNTPPGGLPTAVIAANDPIAFQVYQLLQDRGLRIPDDVSVIGFDDIEKCMWVTPHLTTVHVPKTLIGQKAISVLVENIERPTDYTEEIQLSVSLIERASVRDLRRGK